jgi:hypothetical protein
VLTEDCGGAPVIEAGHTARGRMGGLARAHARKEKWRRAIDGLLCQNRGKKLGKGGARARRTTKRRGEEEGT